MLTFGKVLVVGVAKISCWLVIRLLRKFLVYALWNVVCLLNWKRAEYVLFCFEEIFARNNKPVNSLKPGHENSLDTFIPHPVVEEHILTTASN